MIHSIEVSNFRCLRSIRQDVAPFNVLVGPNGSGKSAFMDAIAFLSDFVKSGLEAVGARSANFYDLLWMGEGKRFDISVELVIPTRLKTRLLKRHLGEDFEFGRYEVGIGLTNDRLAILHEAFLLRTAEPYVPRARLSESDDLDAPGGGWSVVVKKGTRDDRFKAETHEYGYSFNLGSTKSSLANLPEDEEQFPVAVWFKEMLLKGVYHIELNPAELRRPSPFSAKGSVTALPWVVDDLATKYPDTFAQWTAHVRSALPDLKAISSIERPEDRHRYLMLEFDNGAKLPSWVVSDGTLRLLALTLLAYIPGLQGIYMIEEPENGLHPLALQSVFEALPYVYDGQVLLATHSPVVLALAKPEDILCFSKTDEGATEIVRGSEHPKLRDWHGEPSFDVLFASGVLG